MEWACPDGTRWMPATFSRFWKFGGKADGPPSGGQNYGLATHYLVSVLFHKCVVSLKLYCVACFSHKLINSFILLSSCD